MMISTRGRYALRMMTDIGINSSDGPVRIKDISTREGISAKYLEQIASLLSKAGYIKSVRGAQGGYYLSKPASEYTVWMILRETEGPLVPVECMEDEKNRCARASQCVTLRIWSELDEAIHGVVDKYTLQDLIDWTKKQQICE